MKFSLVQSTLGRTEQLARFLAALDAQSHRDFELILVDQNQDERLAPLVARWSRRFAIVHLRQTDQKGLSRGRNLGLPHARGEVVCFPDDDCWYPPETLARVQRRFEAEPGLDGLTGNTTDGAGHRTSARWQRRGGPIDRFNVWTCAISCTIFLRRQMVERAGTFDPRLGPGGDPGRESGDETDYLLQVLARGGRLVFDPGLEVFHLDPVQQIDAAALDRIARYAGGAGLVLRKHDFPLWFVAYFCARPLGGSMVAALRGQPTRARYHLRVLSGRLQGWRAGT